MSRMEDIAVRNIQSKYPLAEKRKYANQYMKWLIWQLIDWGDDTPEDVADKRRLQESPREQRWSNIAKSLNTKPIDLDVDWTLQGTGAPTWFDFSGYALTNRRLDAFWIENAWSSDPAECIIHWIEVEDTWPLTERKMMDLQDFFSTIDRWFDVHIWIHLFDRYGRTEQIIKTTATNEMLKRCVGQSLVEIPESGMKNTLSALGAIA